MSVARRLLKASVTRNIVHSGSTNSRWLKRTFVSSKLYNSLHPAPLTGLSPAVALLNSSNINICSGAVRFSSSKTPPNDKCTPKNINKKQKDLASKGCAVVKTEAKVVAEEVSQYWRIDAKTVLRNDGTPWPWRSFMPWEAYSADTKIDLNKHHPKDTLIDTIAYRTVKALRIPADFFFQKRYGCRAMMLETVAAVPGMVAGMQLHLRSLRNFEHCGGWIRALLEEAENERMHLMTFMEVSQPKWYERALVFTVQGVFFNAYFLAYLLSPRLAHRIVGYLEEEAIHSYTQYLHEIDSGNIPNVPAPAIAIDYWRLPQGSKIRDVVEVVRADEAHHRDVNHFAADIYEAGKELKELPAPVGYH